MLATRFSAQPPPNAQSSVVHPLGRKVTGAGVPLAPTARLTGGFAAAGFVSRRSRITGVRGGLAHHPRPCQGAAGAHGGAARPPPPPPAPPCASSAWLPQPPPPPLPPSPAHGCAWWACRPLPPHPGLCPAGSRAAEADPDRRSRHHPARAAV